ELELNRAIIGQLSVDLFKAPFKSETADAETLKHFGGSGGTLVILIPRPRVGHGCEPWDPRQGASAPLKFPIQFACQGHVFLRLSLAGEFSCPRGTQVEPKASVRAKRRIGTEPVGDGVGEFDCTPQTASPHFPPDLHLDISGGGKLTCARW